MGRSRGLLAGWLAIDWVGGFVYKRSIWLQARRRCRQRQRRANFGCSHSLQIEVSKVAGFKSSVRILGVALWVSGFAAACAQLLGDIETVPGETRVIGSALPDAGDTIVCEEGQTRCDGALLQRCISGGTAWVTTQACATPELCRAADGTSVSQCLTPACAMEQMSCDGAVLLLCNAGRNGWEEFDACESNAHCDATARTCLAAPCEPGQLRCNVGNLERCNDLRTDWELVDECETNELCELTRAGGAGESVGQDPDAAGGGAPGAAPAPPGPSPQTTPRLACEPPACVPGERRCAGNRLEFCNEGRTGWELAETCATPVLCENSLTYAGTGERPRCVPAACGVGEHECTPSGVLQVCDEGRDRFRPLETCIGPPFCNSVQADQGGRGCLDAPCVAGQMQCNGPQRQVCRSDRTGFDAVGVPCETRDLCNDSDPANAVCLPPVCQRGAQSATEFRCQGAVLERCNEQHTGYERFAPCETAGLCNAGFGFQGCRPRVCAPGERRCVGDFVQVCNADLTGFDNFERCAPGTCDSVLGRCAMPCELGTRRCNNQGQVEECRDRLVGREIVARCASPQLCDAATGTCREPPQGCEFDGFRRCRQQGTNTVLEECRNGRSTFVTLDTCSAAAGEVCDPTDVLCDVCQQGSQPACEGNNLVTCAANGQSRTPTPCAFGCQVIPGAPDRCRDCNLGGPGTCGGANGNVLTTCADDADGTGQLRNNACPTAPACRNELGDCNADGDGRDCSCTPCNEGETSCNGAQPTICRDPQAGFVSDGQGACRSPDHCNQTRAGGSRCFECVGTELRCQNGQIQICNGVRFDPPIGPIQCLSGNRVIDCRSGSAQPQTCDPGEFCDPEFGCVVCRPGTISCSGSDAVECNAQGTGFGNPEPCATTSVCREPGRCAVAQGGCVAGAVSPPGTVCTRPGNGSGFCEGTQCLECRNQGNQARCDDSVACTDDSCNAVGTCVHAPVNARCTDSDICDGTETCDVGRGCVNGVPLTDGQMCTLPDNSMGLCDDGVCSQCIGAEARCINGVRQECSNGSFVTDACPSNAPICIGEGECVQCTGSGSQCVNGVRQQCQNGVFSPAPCPSGAPICTGDGQCVECNGAQGCGPTETCVQNTCVECTAGQARCANGERQVCQNGSFVDLACPAETALCVGAGECVQCDGARGCANGQTCEQNRCVGPVCGDGVCSTGEDCPGDCPPQPVCGNGVLEGGEDCDGEARRSPCPPETTDARQCVQCTLIGACVDLVIDPPIDPVLP